MTFSSEEYGYVLEGSKPISLRNFPALDNFPITKDFKRDEKEFNNTLLVREAIPIWNKFCSAQKDFVLKAVALNKQVSPFLSTLEVSFINVFELQEVIKKNIDLFRYVLGPTNSVQGIVDTIAHSNQPLIQLLKYDLTLLGIVLGFGSHNSIVGGRLETIFSLSISKDHPPFTPQSYLIHDKGNHSFDALTPERYGTYYLELAGGDDINFRVDLPRQQPHLSFANVAEEVAKLDELEEPIPPFLWEQPKFIFGAFQGGPPNQLFFKHLRKTQKKVRALLEKSDFLECTLGKINEERPVTRLQKMASCVTASPISCNAKMFSEVLCSALNRFDKEGKLAFIKAFCNPTDSSRNPPIMMGASITAFKGLKIARTNLAKADTQFEMLPQDSSCKEIVSKRLYFKTNLSSNDKQLKEEDHVRIGYVIKDPEGHILFANHDSWLYLSQTIPGFAHGIQGMHIQEKRTLFIHPTLGYGALTTLPPCSALIIEVHLLDIDSQDSGALPPLTPLNLSWIQEVSLYEDIEESLKQQPSFTGSFYREMLDKIKKSKELGSSDWNETEEKELKTLLESYLYTSIGHQLGIWAAQ
jgi:FKBP-type peptidyl-prolyl cis-trans isomerase